MKKKLYYAMPFIAVPALMLLYELFDTLGLIQMSPYIIAVCLLLVSAAFGFFSSSENVFDYVMTVIMPLSMFCFMFIIGFLSKSDMETRFHLYKAVDASFQPFTLLLCLSMAIVTLLTSLKRFRNLKKRI